MQQRHARRCRPKCSISTITLVKAGMSDPLLGNQARADYGDDNERLRSAVCCFLPPLYLFKTRRNFLEVKFQENCQAQARLGISPKVLAGDSDFFFNSEAKFQETKAPTRLSWNYLLELGQIKVLRTKFEALKRWPK